MQQPAPCVLVVEDGDEYLENLSRFVRGPRYLQAHTGSQALELLAHESVDLIYLDMRFDRIARDALLGDLDAVTAQQGGSPERALRHLANHQGLYILQALREGGHGEMPVILAYDFSREQRRFAHLGSLHPSLTWVPDAVTPGEIHSRMERLLGRGSYES